MLHTKFELENQKMWSGNRLRSNKHRTYIINATISILGLLVVVGTVKTGFASTYFKEY